MRSIHRQIILTRAQSPTDCCPTVFRPDFRRRLPDEEWRISRVRRRVLRRLKVRLMPRAHGTTTRPAEPPPHRPDPARTTSAQLLRPCAFGADEPLSGSLFTPGSSILRRGDGEGCTLRRPRTLRGRKCPEMLCVRAVSCSCGGRSHPLPLPPAREGSQGGRALRQSGYGRSAPPQSSIPLRHHARSRRSL